MIRFFATLILMTFSTLVFSQNFKLGFQASPHLTWMSSSKGVVQNNELNLGIKYGLEADLYIAGYPRYSVNTGMYVANFSFSAHYAPEAPFFIGSKTFSEPVNLLFKMNYIEVPLNIKLRSDLIYRMTFYGQFGLSNLFNISATAQSDDNQFSGDRINDGFQNRSISFYTLNMIMGGGMEYDVGGNTSITLGLQYSNGLTDVTQIRNLNEKTIFNSARLVLGVMF